MVRYHGSRMVVVGVDDNNQTLLVYIDDYSPFLGDPDTLTSTPEISPAPRLVLRVLDVVQYQEKYWFVKRVFDGYVMLFTFLDEESSITRRYSIEELEVGGARVVTGNLRP